MERINPPSSFIATSEQYVTSQEGSFLSIDGAVAEGAKEFEFCRVAVLATGTSVL